MRDKGQDEPWYIRGEAESEKRMRRNHQRGRKKTRKVGASEECVSWSRGWTPMSTTAGRSGNIGLRLNRWVWQHGGHWWSEQELNVEWLGQKPYSKETQGKRRQWHRQLFWQTLLKRECDGQLYVSTWLGHWVPRHLVKRCSGCVCEGVSGLDYIWTGRLSKVYCLPCCGWTSSNQWQTWIEGKGWVRENATCLTALSWDCVLFWLSDSSWDIGLSWVSSILDFGLVLTP